MTIKEVIFIVYLSFSSRDLARDAWTCSGYFMPVCVFSRKILKTVFILSFNKLTFKIEHTNQKTIAFFEFARFACILRQSANAWILFIQQIICLEKQTQLFKWGHMYIININLKKSFYPAFSVVVLNSLENKFDTFVNDLKSRAKINKYYVGKTSVGRSCYVSDVLTRSLDCANFNEETYYRSSQRSLNIIVAGVLQAMGFCFGNRT